VRYCRIVLQPQKVSPAAMESFSAGLSREGFESRMVLRQTDPDLSFNEEP